MSKPNFFDLTPCFPISFLNSSSDVKTASSHRFNMPESAAGAFALRPLGQGEALRPKSDEAPLQPGRNNFPILPDNQAPLFRQTLKKDKNFSENTAVFSQNLDAFSPKIHASFRPDGIVPARSAPHLPSDDPNPYAFPPAVRAHLAPRNIWVDAGLLGSVAASFLTHGAIFGMLFVHFGHKPMGGDEASDAPQMEMIFAPPSLNSMKGEQVKEQGGGGTPPPPTAAPEPNPTPAQTPVALPVPPEDLSEVGEIAAPNPREKEQQSKPSPSKTEAKSTANKSKISASKSADNPFANLTDVSFEGDPTDMRHKKGQKGGNKGAIDMGVMGPLSMNGKINAPYTSSSTIKGVSSDYGAELDAWIRSHIFYPDDAVRQEMEGASAVHVRLDRKGHVQQVYLKGSSGYGSLDMATVSIFQGQKLPDVPDDMKGDHFDIDVQVNYLLIRH